MSKKKIKCQNSHRAKEETTLKVILVDDSLVSLQFAKAYLRELPEVTDIILCQDPVQVQNIIDQENIDIILLDVIMPQISGFDVLEKLRSDENYNSIPIIMLTSLTDRESYMKCFELGANDYIAKPIKKDDFYARVKVAIRTRKHYLDLRELVALTTQQNLKLKESNAKLLDAKNSLMQAEKMAAIGQLAAGIAHEINNPVGFVSSNLESLKTYFFRTFNYLDFVESSLPEFFSKDNEPMNPVAQQINEMYRKLKIPLIRDDINQLFSETFSGLARVTEIILSLRIFSHSDSGTDKSLSNLNIIINQVLLICKNEGKYVAEIETHIDNELMIYGNNGQLAQVFMNIIINSIHAIKYQQRDAIGHIEIWADLEENCVCVHISDDGPGIPKDNYNKILDPFFTTKEVGQGTGLGLSISYDIVCSKHNGKLEFTSELGYGTEFIVKIPIIK